jgi:hypothetical protein
MKPKHFARAAVIACAAMSTSVFAHEAKTLINGKEVVQDYTGYTNFENTDCCSRVHCHPLPKSRYSIGPDGTVVINRIEKDLPALVVAPSNKKRAKAPSIDGQYHECTLNGEKGGDFLCLIGPDGKTAELPQRRFALASFVPNFSGVRERLMSFVARPAPDGPICTGRQ